MGKYINEAGADALRKFKYKGSDISVAYQQVWGPFAEILLKFVPETWAPNAITLVGTLIHILGCVTLASQGIGSPAAPWTILFFSLCVIIYYNIDNIDGKQARRTGNSTPLGMCMDHGCDALGVSFITLGVAMTAAVPSERIIVFSAQFFVLGSFWLSVWAQYHSNGVLILGKINAVDDGIPFVSFLAFITFIFGQDFWFTTVIGGLKLQDLLVAFIWISATLQIVVFIKDENFTKDVGSALKHLFRFPLLASSLLCIFALTDWPERYFFPIYFCTALVVVRDITYMHLCVVTEEKYNQFSFPNLVYAFSFPIYLLLSVGLGITLIPDWLFITVMTAYFVYSYAEFVYCASTEMAEILGIQIFKIKSKPK